ncbi:TPA: myo-inosose-2 dehydratase [Staphylococcus pseudintermedius]|uniref:myo-inosose-2 dehydratase n=1 Tax=Staphylococcus pseudintermedius TaxID=283734 RepID=UPI0019E8BDF3|nr:myo-inosose-2 dehydratase [Staphylococcus pseudintermedius]EGQ4033896.1 myo-inosose-2 dehydratase [Staphylococcus pseudintermedius]EIT1269735.1 myo-inosose-2 dehydratase [Staphylococcus pseudintermedius]EJD5745344.1 myo-inosose-2 dehydratase [Staphylococcus pseudintermedius]EJJ6355361.1 myo-inosose-2 dehydratase [Staphylococcus pseudintermedius]MCE5471718.1 myo-inosose-2 dehydratase [Staphylococcus pseudintermedius]
MTKFIKYACAPIAWTNDDLPELGKENSFEQCISEMALAGYEGTEIGNKYPKDVEVLKSYLKPRNLSVASAWLSLYLTTKPYEETEKSFIAHMNFLKALGAKVIVVSEQGKSIQGDIDCPLFKFKPTFNDEEWNKLIDGLHRLGSIARDNGMKIVYHHHMGTGVQNTEEIKRLMDATDPKLVSLLYDTGHLHFSGEDIVDIFNLYMDRIHHIHFKDIRGTIVEHVKKENLSFLEAVKQGAFTVPGDGDIDFKPILEMIYESDYSGWIVVEAEQDPAVANPFLYAKKAKEYINAI